MSTVPGSLVESNKVSNERVIKLSNGEESYVKRSSIKDPSRTAALTNLYFENSHLSKLHAVIKQIDGSFYLKDLESTFGTILNGDFIFSNKFFKLKTDDIIGFIISKPSSSITRIYDNFEDNESHVIPLSEFNFPQVALEFIISIQNDVIKFVPLSGGKSSKVNVANGITKATPIDVDNEGDDIEVDKEVEEVKSDDDDDEEEEEEEEEDVDYDEEDDSFYCRAMAGSIQRYEPPQYSESDISVDDDSESNDSKTLVIDAEVSEDDDSSSDITLSSIITKVNDKPEEIKGINPNGSQGGVYEFCDEDDYDYDEEEEAEEEEESEEEDDEDEDDEDEDEDEDLDDSSENIEEERDVSQPKDQVSFGGVEVIEIDAAEIGKDLNSDGSEEIDSMNEDSEDDDDEEEEENDDEEEEVEDDDEDEEVNEEDEEDTESDRDAHCVGYCLSSAKGSCIPQACERSCELDDEDYEDLELYLAKRSKRKACLNDSSDFSDYEVEDLITQELRNMVADLSSDSSSELYSDSEEVDSNSDLDSDSVWDSISEDSNPDTAFDAAVDEAQCCGYSIQPNPRKRSLWEIEDNEVDSVDEPAKKKEKKETSYVKAFAREAGKGLLYVLATVVALGVYGGTISSQK